MQAHPIKQRASVQRQPVEKDGSLSSRDAAAAMDTMTGPFRCRATQWKVEWVHSPAGGATGRGQFVEGRVRSALPGHSDCWWWSAGLRMVQLLLKGGVRPLLQLQNAGSGTLVWQTAAAHAAGWPLRLSPRPPQLPASTLQSSGAAAGRCLGCC